MIRLERVRLINWHNFADDIIPFKTITYLIGVNAVGKTTILDAVRYCLTTNKDFNTAGNKKSGRTLQGSVHQKQRAADEYLRPGHTVSYIGIEFFDDSIRKYFVIVTRVESESPYQELKSVYQDWYITKPGHRFEDLPFFIKTSSGRRPAKREEFRLNDKGMDRASSQADARRRICRQLGIGDADSNNGRKFNKVFHMGTSLEDITDIRKFIYTYILPDPEVDIEGLYEDMQRLQELQDTLKASKQRAELLLQINEQLDIAVTYDSRVKVYEALLAFAQWQADIDKEKRIQEDIESRDLELSALSVEIEKQEVKYREAAERLEQVIRQLNDDDNLKALNSLQSELEDNKKKREQLKKAADDFRITVKHFESLINDLGKYDELKLNDIALPSTDTAEFIKAIAEIKTKMSSLSDPLIDMIGRKSLRIKSLDDEITALSEEIKKLQKGQMVYPSECDVVLSAIDNMFAQHGIDQKAKLLCELLYMNIPEWQDAVESYLGVQRFYIIVPPKYYHLAKTAFVSLGDSVKGIGLIDTVSLMKKPINKEIDGVLTLSETVGTQNPYARAYVDFLLENVVCCESADELERYQKSVTADRLRYQGFVLKRMKKQALFIGQDAFKYRLEQARKDQNRKRIDKDKLVSEKKALSSVGHEYQSFMNGNAFLVLSTHFRAEHDADELMLSIEILQKRIDELENNPLMREMIDRREECRIAKEKEENAYVDLKSKSYSLQDQITSKQNQLHSAAERKKKSEAAYNEYLKSHSQYIPDMEKEYSELIKSRMPADIIANNQSQGTLQRRKNDFDKIVRENLIPLQQQYNALYSMDYHLGLEGPDKYRSAYRSLVQIDLEKHQHNLSLAQIRCKERFRKEVLFRMKDDIEKANRLFKELRRVMSDLRYGEEKFEFYISGSKDKELRMFYNLIMDKDNRQIQEEPDLFSFAEEPTSDVFESQIEEFMQRIMIEVEERSKQSASEKMTQSIDVSRYADYRTYLDYDILITNLVTGNTSFLSQVSGDGSGGENQVPFYIAICASLLQIYQQSDNCIRLILLDEAFNNMTSDRIKPMMEMFKELNLQLILIATTEKCTTIQPYCDLTNSIVKQGSRNAVRSFERVSV